MSGIAGCIKLSEQQEVVMHLQYFVDTLGFIPKSSRTLLSSDFSIRCCLAVHPYAFLATMKDYGDVKIEEIPD